MPGSTSEAVCQELLRRDVLVDFRPNAGVRFSPHFYNTMEEIDRAIQTVDEILTGMRAAARV
jgi:kynureninase